MSSVMSNELLQPLSLLVSPDGPVNSVVCPQVTESVPISTEHPVDTAVQRPPAPAAILPFSAGADSALAFGPADTAVSFQLAEPAEKPELTYSEWFRENVVESKWMTPYVTFYAHWLLFILLAILVVHGPDRRGDFTITASTIVPDELVYEPVEILDTRIVEPEPVAIPKSEAATMVPVDMRVTKPIVPESMTAAAESAGEPEPAESPAALANPAPMLPRHAVTCGSFSVWTVPENPDAGEAYKIVIQAKVPDGIAKFPVTDLQGVVVGSDGYRKLIPGSMHGFLPIDRGYVQFEVHIVAADAEIKDTVWIRSRMLKEQQNLLIEF